MRQSNFALRVPPTLLAEARKAAESEGVAHHPRYWQKSFPVCAGKNTLSNVARRSGEAQPDSSSRG